MKPLLSHLLAEGCDENDPRLFIGVVKDAIEDDGCQCGPFLAMALEVHRLFEGGHIGYGQKYHVWLSRMDSSIDWEEWMRDGMQRWRAVEAKAEGSGTLDALLEYRKAWLKEEALARKAMARALDRTEAAVATVELVDKLLHEGTRR
jgi:hypothetical protein